MSINNSQQISDIKTMLVKGMNGEGIESIEKTATEGFIDTYTITYTDGTKTTFDVTNGNWGIWTSAVTAVQGATSVTINNDSIVPTSILEVYSQNASGTVITVNDIDVTPGAAVLSFPALAEATDFILHIVNGTASGGGGGGGTSDYPDLTNKPQINGVTLVGNKPSSDFGLQNIFQGTIAEWNQLTTAEKKAYDHASIPDSLDGNVTFPASKVIMTGGENVEDALTYSTTEHKVGKWIDGSDLYEKTVDFGALPNATSKSVAHGIAGLATMVNIYGFAKNPTNNVQIALPFVDITAGGNISFLVSANNIIIIDANDMSVYTQAYVSIRYTKNS